MHGVTDSGILYPDFGGVGGFRYGALAVVEQPKSSHWVNQELRKIDPRLFVEMQLTLDQEEVWCVSITLDGEAGAEIMCVHEWRNDDGEPIRELTSSLVDRVAAIVRSGPVNLKLIAAKNQALRDRKAAEAREEMKAIVADRMVYVGGRKRGIPLFNRVRERHHGRHALREARLRASDRAIVS